MIEETAEDKAERAATRASRLAWATLLARVFAVDTTGAAVDRALTCPGCGGRMRTDAPDAPAP